MAEIQYEIHNTQYCKQYTVQYAIVLDVSQEQPEPRGGGVLLQEREHKRDVGVPSKEISM